MYLDLSDNLSLSIEAPLMQSVLRLESISLHVYNIYYEYILHQFFFSSK